MAQRDRRMIEDSREWNFDRGPKQIEGRRLDSHRDDLDCWPMHLNTTRCCWHQDGCARDAQDGLARQTGEVLDLDRVIDHNLR